ncbi:MAG: hypothetical protein IJ193_00035 [Bacilli bacterium]|nr:hypothetical protein [Bacilli bacterium]
MSDPNIKFLNLEDTLNTRDNADIKSTITGESRLVKAKHYRPHTEIKLFVDEGDGKYKLKWNRSNMMTLGVAGTLCRFLFDLPTAQEVTPNYNNMLLLDNTITTTSGQTSPTKVFGFCVGNDHGGEIPSDVYKPFYHDIIHPNPDQYGRSIIPFRYCPLDDDITDDKRAIYLGRKTLSEYYAYYFKAFDSNPIFSQHYTNGDPIDSNVYDIQNDMEVETTVSINMSITKDDCREYFYYGGSAGGYTINDAKINCISLVMGWPYEVDGFRYMQDIRPITLLTMPLESLIDLRKSLIIAYTLFF